MKLDQWLSLGLHEEHYPIYQGGAYSSIEAAGVQVIAVPRRSQLRPGYAMDLLATAGTPEEAGAIAVVLRLLNPI